MNPHRPSHQQRHLQLATDDHLENEGSDYSYRTSLASTPDLHSPVAHDVNFAQYGVTTTTLMSVHDLLVAIAKDAGKTMLNAEAHIIEEATSKNNTSDLVTHYDKTIEAMVVERTRQAFPRFKFIGEETCGKDAKLTDEPTFVCDPIDGTLNFTNGVANFAISLAFTIEQKPVVGVVFNPLRGDLFTAVKGHGSYLTKVSGERYRLPMRTAPLTGLDKCLVAVEWGNQRSGPNWALRTSVHNALLTSKAEGGAMCKSVRSNGSAALDFCYVAQGVIDAFWEGGVWIWDVAAGWIILEEAGGMVASANPGDWNPTLEGRLYFAVRHAKRDEQMGIVKELWGFMGDRKFVY